MAVNHNDAPIGFVAVESEGCEGCAFRGDVKSCRETTECGGAHRKDGCSVIFVAAPQPSAIWPYDSEGTPVEVNHG